MVEEALYYTGLEAEQVRCELCPHRCRIAPGGRGICKARENRGGRLYSLSYGEISSLAVDPIEKKPLYHFYPGSSILSLGSFGCNFFCLFCQNWQISQQEVGTRSYTPEEILREAQASGSIGVAYTYNEPITNYEFVLATARLVQAAGLRNVLVSNGYINPEPLGELLAYIDAVNLDIKAGSNDFYSALCGGNIKPVLATAESIVRAGVHLEVTTLLIPEENDDPEELRWLAGWIAEKCGRDTVVHLSAYFPQYRFDTPQTKPEELLAARKIFKGELDYVYCGNMALGAEYSNTCCLGCGAELVSRSGYRVEITGVDAVNRACRECGAELPFFI